MLGHKDVCVYCLNCKKMYHTIECSYPGSSYKQYHSVCCDCFKRLSEEYGSKYILESISEMKKKLKKERGEMFRSYKPDWMKSSVHYIKAASKEKN